MNFYTVAKTQSRTFAVFMTKETQLLTSIGYNDALKSLKPAVPLVRTGTQGSVA